ncbi:MAG: hypothetical protein HOV81_07855 [Kofleriaceae bacterium]|nr:hypothetical protein [Kofleriaceae bacterium]
MDIDFGVAFERVGRHALEIDVLDLCFVALDEPDMELLDLRARRVAEGDGAMAETHARHPVLQLQDTKQLVPIEHAILDEELTERGASPKCVVRRLDRCAACRRCTRRFVRGNSRRRSVRRFERTTSMRTVRRFERTTSMRTARRFERTTSMRAARRLERSCSRLRIIRRSTERSTPLRHALRRFAPRRSELRQLDDLGLHSLGRHHGEASLRRARGREKTAFELAKTDRRHVSSGVCDLPDKPDKLAIHFQSLGFATRSLLSRHRLHFALGPTIRP